MQTASAGLTAAKLYDRYLRDVYRYVSRRIPRREDAEDATAEVFQAAFRCLHLLRAADNPRVWLLGIARRKVVDHLRKHGRGRELLNCDLPDSTLNRSDNGAGDPALALRRSESSRMIRRALAELSEDHREALLLQYAECLSIVEVAEVMGRSLAATNSLLQRARAAVYREAKDYFLPIDDRRPTTDDGPHASRIMQHSPDFEVQR